MMAVAEQRFAWGGRIEIGHHARPRAAAKKTAELPLFEDRPPHRLASLGTSPPIDGGEEATAERENPSPSAASGSRQAAAHRALLSSPTRGEEERLKAERAELLTKLEPLGRYSYRRRRLEEQLAALTTRLLALELGRAR